MPTGGRRRCSWRSARRLRLTGWVLRPAGPGRHHARHRDRAAQVTCRRRGAGRRTQAPGPLVQRDGRQRPGRARTAARLVADASHQLRNPLSALLLRIELLALELPEGNEEIASVRTEGKRLAQVLDDLLDLALAEHAAPDLCLTDVGALAAERVASWRPLAAERGVRLSGDCPATTGWADPVALSSALDAVIDNALKFTPEGGAVQVTVASSNGTTTVVVGDEGPGLTEDELARVGDRFWRSNRHQNVKGSGLGLSISRALLAAGGGSLTYERNEPHGLKVTVGLPRSEPVTGS
ncbi:histidine kinase OS=Streptomyces alboniger OX=132473 GN=CP975_26660 PE=4 SV=1 [Streptomyces alboniger]